MSQLTPITSAKLVAHALRSSQSASACSILTKPWEERGYGEFLKGDAEIMPAFAHDTGTVSAPTMAINF
jgi:hypothetical protein